MFVDSLDGFLQFIAVVIDGVGQLIKDFVVFSHDLFQTQTAEVIGFNIVFCCFSFGNLAIFINFVDGVSLFESVDVLFIFVGLIQGGLGSFFDVGNFFSGSFGLDDCSISSVCVIFGFACCIFCSFYFGIDVLFGFIGGVDGFFGLSFGCIGGFDGFVGLIGHGIQCGCVSFDIGTDFIDNLGGFHQCFAVFSHDCSQTPTLEFIVFDIVFCCFCFGNIAIFTNVVEGVSGFESVDVLGIVVGVNQGGVGNFFNFGNFCSGSFGSSISLC